MDSRFRFHLKLMLLFIKIVMLTLISCCARSRLETSWVSSIKLKDLRKCHMSKSKKEMKQEERFLGQGIDLSRRRSFLQLFWNLEGNRKWERRTSSPLEERVRWGLTRMRQRRWAKSGQQTRKHSESLWSALTAQSRTSWTSPTRWCHIYKLLRMDLLV